MDRGNRDDMAAARVAQAYQTRADQTTADTPGLLPTPVVGGVVNLIDAQRPLIVSLGGAKPLGNIPGLTFSRPKIRDTRPSESRVAKRRPYRRRL